MGKANKPAAAWLQQPKETAVAFAAFREYCEMDPEERSLRKVAKKLGKSGALIDRWSSRNNWQERVLAHDREVAREAYEASKIEVRKMARRHVALGKNLQAKAIQALSNLQPEEMDAKTILAFLREGVSMERRGQYSEVGALNRAAHEGEPEDGQGEDSGPVIITGEGEIKD